MSGLHRLLPLLVLAVLAATPARAQVEPQIFNAFAVVVANGTIVRAAEKEFMVVGTIAGPFFIETEEGPVESGKVVCAASVRIDQATAKTGGGGACTFTAQDGAAAWGEWQCEGYMVVGCRGTLKLAGGNGRLAGITGEGTMIWRPNARELNPQLEGATLQNITGILLWRDFKIAGRQ